MHEQLGCRGYIRTSLNGSELIKGEFRMGIRKGEDGKEDYRKEEGKELEEAKGLGYGSCMENGRPSLPILKSRQVLSG